MKYIMILLAFGYLFLLPETGLSQSEEGVITIGVQTIRASIRRPTIQLIPERMKPGLNPQNNNLENFNNQIKERPKLDFYIRKDSEVPTAVDPDRLIKRSRN